MARGPITDEEQLCVEGEVCANDHEPQFGHCIMCSAIAPCTSNADLACKAMVGGFGLGYHQCKGQVILYPYAQQAELRSAYRLGGIPAIEEIVRPRGW